MVFVAYGLAAAMVSWIIMIGLRWQATKRAEAETYHQYMESGELDKRVERADFRDVFMRSEGPLFGTVLLGSTLIAIIMLPVLLIVFNLVWQGVWRSGGQSPVMEVGQLPHLIVLTVVMVGALFAIAYVCMRWYHERRPKKLRTEIARLNGETGGA
ncbi:MAG: hypothetical protein AAF950_13530 [Pseudomonadota bacterium]